jgi:hypothetical protein
MKYYKTRMLKLIVCAVGLVLGQLHLDVALGITTEECQGMGFLCGDCFSLIETACNGENILIDAECDGEMVQGTVTASIGTYVDYRPYPVGSQCHNNVGKLSQCQSMYTYDCDGDTLFGVYIWYEHDENLCGDSCFIAYIDPKPEELPTSVMAFGLLDVSMPSL